MKMIPTKLIRGFAATAATLIASFAVAASPVVVCGLTGQSAPTCCCTQKDGKKLVCNHTGQVLDHCCCTIQPSPETKK